MSGFKIPDGWRVTAQIHDEVIVEEIPDELKIICQHAAKLEYFRRLQLIYEKKSISNLHTTKQENRK